MKFSIEGRVIDADTHTALGGITVKVFVGRSPRGSATSVTNNLGIFTAFLAALETKIFSSAVVKFALSLPNEKDSFFTTKPIHLDKLRDDRIVIAVPDNALSSAFSKGQLALLVDGAAAPEVEIGQTLSIAGSRFRPTAPHEIRLRLDGNQVASLILMTDQFGAFEPTVIAPQIGLWAFDSGEAFNLKKGRSTFAGQTLTAEVVHGKKVVSRGKIKISDRSSHPIGFISDAEGRVQNSIQDDRDSLHLTIANMPRASLARVFIVPRQGDWNLDDPIAISPDRNGRPLIFDLELSRGEQTVQLRGAGELLPGAYDLIVRPVRYGYEEDEELLLLANDLVIGRQITGLVVREEFFHGKPVLGGCVNTVPMSGSPVSGPPYFRYRDTFVVGENIWAALDPGIVVPGQIGKKIAYYVIQSKTQAQWGVSTALPHVPPGQPIEVILQSGCINANKALVWPTSGPKGNYDIVADFGNNAQQPGNFMKDGSFDTPHDMIDGYFNPGFRIVDDPGTMSEFTHVGAFEINAALLAGLGLGANLTVEDEVTMYFDPADFISELTTFPRLAIVRFPADIPNATTAAQISAVRPNYPLAVVVHGNGHLYTNYAFLLEHLARNGFVAMSIHIQNDEDGLGRANAFFDHLNTIKAVFGNKLQDKVGVLGHSRGGEAVFKIARLNNSLALGIGLKALIALGPTDQYGAETITGAASVPLFVLYGAKDDDVAGWDPYAGYNVRQTGFSLYDRYDDKDKSMAFVYEATHNGFVTENEINVALAKEDQRKILLAYVNAFFRMHLRDEPEWVGMFTGEWKPPSVGATPAKIFFQYRDTDSRVVDNFQGTHTPTSWEASTIGDTVAQTGLPANPTETQLYPQDNQSPHDTGGLRFTWNSSGDELNFAIPNNQRNVSGFSTLSIRVGQVLNSLSNPAGPQNFRLTLRDVGGNERAIRVSAFGTVPQPAEANTVGNKKSAMNTIRIPLSAYTVVCAGAVPVDLTHVTNVKLQFLDIPTGEIAIDELEFAN